jgi:hypothetical protein
MTSGSGSTTSDGADTFVKTGHARRPARRRRLSGADVVAGALQRYADRGVFRGLSSSEGRGGRREFRYTWLTRRPMIVTYDLKTATLTFKDLLPGVAAGSGLGSELKAIVNEQTGSAVPPARRIDARRARVLCRIRQRHLSLVLVVRGTHHTYAVQKGLNLVNQLFLHLHAYYPEYLVEQFGFSSE